jgi:hypothetical protein
MRLKRRFSTERWYKIAAHRRKISINSEEASWLQV